MQFNSLKGYFLAIPSGLVLLAAALLVVLQWGNAAEFSLYGKNFSVHLTDGGKVIGGVNTTLLMIFSAAGGVVMVLVGKMMVRGLMALRRAGRSAKASAKASPKAPVDQEQSQA